MNQNQIADNIRKAAAYIRANARRFNNGSPSDCIMALTANALGLLSPGVYLYPGDFEAVAVAIGIDKQQASDFYHGRWPEPFKSRKLTGGGAENAAQLLESLLPASARRKNIGGALGLLVKLGKLTQAEVKATQAFAKAFPGQFLDTSDAVVLRVLVQNGRLTQAEVDAAKVLS
jgi:hypothetical protein